MDRAVLIPAFSTCSQLMTSGERRLAQRLQEKLEQDYLVWYNVPVGRNRLYPDFILLHPLRGLIILEVKDWSLENIKEINPSCFKVLASDGVKSFDNPLEQARRNALAIVNQLQGDSLLVQSEGRYKGKLCFPFSYGAVFPNIKRQALEKAYFLDPLLEDVLPAHLVICQDEMVPSVDPMEFQERLWNFCTYQFGEPLTLAQIDRIRWNIFPEIRIGDWAATEADSDHEDVTIPDVIRVMDIEQEQLARSLGDGHRVIHGVAGSGKTMILVYRCIHLAEQAKKPILVLCFNVALASMLRQKLHAAGVGNRVVICNIHKWCSDLLWKYRIQKPSRNQYSKDAYWDEMVLRVLAGVEGDRIPGGQYGAVLVDEGHDFKPEWYKLVVRMVDPDTKSLLVLYDDAQSIYEKRQQKAFSFKSVGIEARGRTKVLKINYRNTEEILSLAYEFAHELLTSSEGNDEDAPILIQPESAGRHGAKPQLVRLPSFRHEVNYLAEEAQKLHSQGVAWNDMGIIYRLTFMAEEIESRFAKYGIPVEWINRDLDSRNYDPAEDSIKLTTMQSSKGLEFPVVFIPGLGFMPKRGGEPEGEARLLYVAMTRAIDQLVLTGDRKSPFMDRLQEIVSV